MATIEFTLSSKNDRITQEHEILMRFFHGRRINQRAKTKIYIKADYWQPAVIDDDKRKVATRAHIVVIDIPTLPRLKTPEKMRQYNEQLELREILKAKQKRLDDIEKKVIETFQESDIESVANNSKWLQTTIDEILPKRKTTQTDEVSFFDKFDEYIERNDVTFHRKQLYKVVKRLLMRFELYTKTKITFENLCSDTLFSFEEFATNEHTFCDSESYRAILAQVEESRTPKPRGKNTIVDIMKILRAFIKWTKQCEGKDPFDGYQIGECVYNETPYYLTVEERNRLYDYDFSFNKQLEKQRDIFVFQCFVGARVSDLWNFTKDNLIERDDTIAVEYIAQKTMGENAVVTRVPLTEKPKNILDKYKDYNGKTLFPFTSQQRYNIDIKKILQAAGIDRMVTTLNPTNRKYEQHPLYEVASSHIARRTFIGNIYKVVQDPNLIGSMSGHKEGSKAFARYRAIDDDIKKNVLSKIE